MSHFTSQTLRKAKSGTLFGLAVGTTLLAHDAAFAQKGAITPSPLAAVPAPPEAPAPAIQQPGDGQSRLDLRFVDIDIARLLQIISEQFNVDIVVSDDVTGTLRSINLTGKTPEEAIQRVVLTAGLQSRRLKDGTYIVAKKLPPEADAGTTPAIAQPVGPAFQGTGQLPGGFGNGGIDAGITPTIPQWTNPGTIGSAATNDLPPLVDSKQRQRKRTQYIALHNVRPGILAYWLDPANNETPREFVKSKTIEQRTYKDHPAKTALSSDDLAAMNGNSSTVLLPQFQSSGINNPYVKRSGGDVLSNSRLSSGFMSDAQFAGGNRRPGAGGAGGGAFNLPDGVDRVVAIDPQNALLVFGTEDGVRQLQDIIGKLDVPMRQVEIEAQFVTVSTTDSRAFGIDYLSALGNFTASTNQFAPGTTTGSFQVGFIKSNFQATLNTLVSTNRAKVLTAPRVLAINNLTASLQSSTQTPIILTSSTSNIGGTVQGSQNLIYIETDIGLTVTPTINNDDTVTVYMQPEFSSQTPSGLANGAPVINQQTVDTIANVHDGETIALGGLKSKSISVAGGKIPLVGDIPFIGKLFRSRTAADTESELIIFLTARIQRHVGDDVNLANG